MSFGKNLQCLRKMHHGMTQEELAEKLGVSRQTVSKWELDSAYPEMDALNHVKEIALQCGVREPQLIGWDFPFLSQEQMNVFHMHGYAAAWILPENMEVKHAEVIAQDAHNYMAMTIKEPFEAPFDRIPNAYKALMSYMQANSIQMKHDNEVLPCFEKEYTREGTVYMDVYIAVK